MNCDSANKLLDEMECGELTPQQERELEGHCLLCQNCAATLALLKAENAALARLKEPELPGNMERAVMEKLKAEFAPPLKVSDCIMALSILLVPVLATMGWSIAAEHNPLPEVSSSLEAYLQLLPNQLLEAAGSAGRNLFPAQSVFGGMSGMEKVLAAALGLGIVLASRMLPDHKLNERRHL